MKSISIYLDGACKPNPGDCAYGFILYDENHNIIEKSGAYIGMGTNNIAEYCGLIFGLLGILKKGVKQTSVYTDSLLLVKQIKKEYKVKEEVLKKFNLIATDILSLFEEYTIKHIPDTQNKEAHKIANSFLPGENSGVIG